MDEHEERNTYSSLAIVAFIISPALATILFALRNYPPGLDPFTYYTRVYYVAVLGLVGIVFGIKTLLIIHITKQKGRGLAIAAILSGSLFFLGFLAALYL